MKHWKKVKAQKTKRKDCQAWYVDELNEKNRTQTTATQWSTANHYFRTAHKYIKLQLLLGELNRGQFVKS